MTHKFKIAAFHTALLLSVVIVLNACSPVTAQRGNMLDDTQLPKVVAGESTMRDVLQTFGSPTAQSTFDTKIWYYIGQETEKYGILDHEVIDERIISVTFNDQGIVQAVEEIDTDRLDVPYSDDSTPTHGNDFTFLQQLLGNVGRFNAPQGNSAETASGGL